MLCSPGLCQCVALERSETICVRMTPAEKERLRREAAERGLSLSEYLRIKLLG
ncbi:plasmid mobilization protein [Infirmifilum sp. SLHALR2]